MKLPDFKLDATLNDLRARMGIPPDQFGDFSFEASPGTLTVDELQKLVTGEGIDLEFDELTQLPDGTFAYKDSRVLVYIRDVRPFRGTFHDPRYHFSHCTKLNEMRTKNRFGRYVVATESTGQFRINHVDGNSITSHRKHLDVCQMCLEKFRYNGFSREIPRTERINIVKEFTPGRFFATYPRDLADFAHMKSADIAPVDNYPERWRELSRVTRNDANWTCKSCKLVLSGQNKKFLHVHHKNGVLADVTPVNLVPLCIRCHSREPLHSHIRALPDFKEFVALFP